MHTTMISFTRNIKSLQGGQAGTDQEQNQTSEGKQNPKEQAKSKIHKVRKKVQKRQGGLEAHRERETHRLNTGEANQ